jgi:hypothetical protein
MEPILEASTKRTVVNKKTFRGAVILIGRLSVFGNPFSHLSQLRRQDRRSGFRPQRNPVSRSHGRRGRFAAASILKGAANRIGDLLDDGKPNSSFKG